MKKVFIISILSVLVLGSSAFAQQKPFVFGFKVAPNIGWMHPSTDDYERNGAKLGFSWGFLAEFYLMENYSINSGVDISFLNATLKYQDDIPEYGNQIQGYDGVGELRRTYNFKYIKVPFTLKMKTNEYANKSFFGTFGFGFNFLIAGKAKDEFIVGTEKITDDRDIKGDLKGFRTSLIIGVGAEFDIQGPTKLIAGINFDNGFTDVLKNQNNHTGDQHKSINNFVEFYIGILF